VSPIPGDVIPHFTANSQASHLHLIENYKNFTAQPTALSTRLGINANIAQKIKRI
jgi:hypothetical protein